MKQPRPELFRKEHLDLIGRCLGSRLGVGWEKEEKERDRERVEQTRLDDRLDNSS